MFVPIVRQQIVVHSSLRSRQRNRWRRIEPVTASHYMNSELWKQSLFSTGCTKQNLISDITKAFRSNKEDTFVVSDLPVLPCFRCLYFLVCFSRSRFVIGRPIWYLHYRSFADEENIRYRPRNTSTKCSGKTQHRVVFFATAEPRFLFSWRVAANQGPCGMKTVNL